MKSSNQWLVLGIALQAAATTLMLMVASPAAAQERIRVAVLNFDTYLVEQREWQFPWSASGLGPLATSLLTNELASHRRFTVIERRYIEDLMREQDLGTSDRMNPNAAAQLGQLLGAQVVVVGDVQEFGKKKVGGIGGIASGLVGGRRETMSVVLGARLIDAATGEILATNEGSADVSDGAFGILTRSAGAIVGSELEGEASKVMREAIVDLASNIAEESDAFELEPIIPCLNGMVAAVAGDRVYLALGASTPIAVGDYFKVSDRQEAILDPASGDTLGFAESDRGFVRVTEIQERMSIADVVEGGPFATGQSAARSAAPGDDAACVNVPGSEPPPPPNPAPRADPVPTPAAAAGAAPPARAAADEEATQPRRRYAPPSAASNSPLGTWYLDGDETVRFWVRSLSALSPLYRNLTVERVRESMGPRFDEWRNDIDAMEMYLTIRADSTFHLELRDPATEGLSTVDGTWRTEGLLYVLSGTHVDGIEVERVQEEHVKVGGSRLYGQDPEVGPHAGLVGLFGAWAVRWPNLTGGAFVRAAR